MFDRSTLMTRAVKSGMRFILSLISLVAAVGIAGCGGGTKGIVKSNELTIKSLEGRSDTISFHVGSPLILRIEGTPGRGCDQENGDFFLFSSKRAQLGWLFQEVSDSVLFPWSRGTCARYLMLTSEESNDLAEGYYELSVALLLDERNRRVSDTVVLHPVHAKGASSLSYGAFLAEQIALDAPLLRERETQRELFADHLPKSRTIYLYEAIIRYRSGDLGGARRAYLSSLDQDDTGNLYVNEVSKIVRDLVQSEM